MARLVSCGQFVNAIYDDWLARSLLPFAMRGRLLKEGGVIHIICDRITDHDAMLHSIGRMDFTVTPGRGDGARHGGGPDPRDPAWPPPGRTLSYPPFDPVLDENELLRIKSHDFR